ncbi:hypothetical protein LK996_14220 [Lysobacter sp. A6]|uniref:Uncharacterized protein n=1 Tax=Noviluteimonas lactosilytica TaxID=2888523 RepID=A0ABS8JKW0_9GAMM|nr:hypothetical protein [Lysobacter lactosilyticus]MCC8364229.1 hypothetical protein [Lysobacter lactosilyticus]
MALGIGLVALTAIALVPSEPLEIDGNAVDNNNGGEDWENNSPVVKKDVVASSTTDDVYIQGGSKDERDVSSTGITTNYWQHGFNSVPGKDDLVHAFAKEYPQPSGDKLLYFGATRLVNDGDSAIGFWFFKKSIKELPGSNFSGAHSVGDILITSDFNKGGGSSIINVFVWNGSAAVPLTTVKSSAAGLKPKDPIPQVFCDVGINAPDNGMCAAANKTKVAIPTVFADYVFGQQAVKPADNMFPVGTFFEGAIDLGALGLDPTTCFSSVLAMTRSSSSTDAQLKDYVLQTFGQCGVEVTKVCKATTISTNGQFLTSTYDVNVKAIGGTLTDVAFAEDITLSFGANATTQPTGFPRCKRTDTGQWLQTGTASPMATSLASGDTATVEVACDHTTERLFNNVTGTAGDGADGVEGSFVMEETCEPPFETAVQVTKACDTVEVIAVGNTVQPRVCNKITVTNQSNEGLVNIALVDAPEGGSEVAVTADSLTGAAVPTTLGVNGSFVVTHCYIPTKTNGSQTSPGAAAFLNEAGVSAEGALSGNDRSDTGDVQCRLCPAP